MKAFNVIKFIEKSGLDNSLFHAFEYNGKENQIEFVRRYFGADFTAGLLKGGAKYVAFWGEQNKPEGIPDAILTSKEQGKIYVFRVTL